MKTIHPRSSAWLFYLAQLPAPAPAQPARELLGWGVVPGFRRNSTQLGQPT